MNDPETPLVIKVDRVQKTYTVNFINAQGVLVKTETLNGTTNEVVNVASDVPADYQLAKGVSGQLTLALDATVPMTVNVDQVQKR